MRPLSNPRPWLWLVLLVATAFTPACQQKAKEYNALAEKLIPISQKQNTLLQEFAKAAASPKVFLENALVFIARSEDLEKQSKAIIPEQPELKDIYRHWLERSSQITLGLRATLAALQNPKTPPTYQAHFKKAKDELDAYNRKRDAYFQKYGMTLKP